MKKILIGILAACAACGGGAAEHTSQIWKFPPAQGQRTVTISGIPDWGKKGFSAEVWCKPNTADCGYAMLIRGSFGFPKFFGARDYDNYLVTGSTTNAAGRVYTPLELGKYHYYALTGTPENSISYRDGKAMRTNPGPGIPVYTGTELYVGNSIGWGKNFDGEVALIRIYNRALSPEEIAEHSKLLSENRLLPKRDGLIFEADRRGILPDNAGQVVTAKLDNTSVDRVKRPRSRHIAGKPEKNPAQIGFEDLTGWTVTYTVGEIEPVISRSAEEPLWGDYVLRTEFKRGPQAKPGSKVVLAPPAPIRIDTDFDCIDIWRFATNYRGDNRPKMNYSIQYRTADGKVHSTGPMGGLLDHGWGIHHKPLTKKVPAPVEFISMTFENFNEPSRLTYFDSLRFYTRSQAPLTDAKVPSWQELGVPTRPETILPTPSSPTTVTLKADGKNRWIFTSANADGKKLEFIVTPKTGTFNDIQTTYNGHTFTPMSNGGFHWALNNVYPVRADALLAPASSEVRPTLLSARASGDTLTLKWRYQVKNLAPVTATWEIQLKDNTLIVDLATDSAAVGEMKLGAIQGISGKVVEVPYLNLGNWFHPSFPPCIFAADGLYLSVFADWYNSDASGLFGESSARPGGRLELNRSTSDHRWVEDPNAPDPAKEVRDYSVINGGSYYWPTTAGKRNPLRERVMLTVADRFDAVLPNIPNPAHRYLAETANDVWSTRMWYVDQYPEPDFFKRELAMWQLCKAYGMERFNVRLHGSTNRQYLPRRDGDASTFIENFVDPGLGGNAKMREFFDAMKGLGYRIGVYTDHMLLSQLAYDAWDEDMLNLDPNSYWLYSGGMDKQTKISRMLDLQRKFMNFIKRDFAPNCTYTDQITCPPTWRYTDYDARTPDAGKFSAPYRVFIASVQQDEATFGPVLSEGKTQMFFAGLCDSYAQPQRMNMNVIPNFNLNKLHLLSNDCGYELSLFNWKASGINPEIGSYRALAYQYAYGNTGHIYGPYHGAPYDQGLPPFFIRSYFLIQPLQKFYALEPVKEILYNVNGTLGSVEKAIAADTLACNQVKLVYANGFEVAANLNAKENFEVALHGKKYVLPPDGFAAYLPGQAEAYSALVNGKRSDFARTAELEYRDGESPTPGVVQAAHAYLLKVEPERLTVTPAPFQTAEKVVLDLRKLPGWADATQVKIAGADMNGKTLPPQTASVRDGRLEINVDGQAFKYIITR